MTGFETKNGVHHLKTRAARCARAVGFATGGYTSNGLHPSLDSKIMPILSNSLVTRPLTPQEIAATNFRTHEVITDTRTLRFYYRLLPTTCACRSAAAARSPAPTRRTLVGGRCSSTACTASSRRCATSASTTRGGGWVDVSHDMMPRITQPDPSQSVFYALGYGGNGVSFSAHAGRRMAQRIAGRSDKAFSLPIYGSQLEYPNVFNTVRSRAFAPFRRFGQQFLYRWYYLRDEKSLIIKTR